MRLLDLTQSLSPNTPRSSDHPEVQFPVVRWRSKNGIKTRQIVASLHSGTHVDAPLMYDPYGRAIHDLPLDAFCGSGLVVDAALGEWGVINADLLDRVAGGIRDGDILALWTDWARHYLDEQTYILKAPGLDKSGVDWIVNHKIKAVYSDTASAEHIFMRRRQWQSLRPDIFDRAEFDAADFPPSYGHKTLLPAGIMMVENLSEALGQLVGQRANLIALPAKYEGVEGAPARVAAVIEFP